MNRLSLRTWTGLLFIVGAILVNIPYTLLITNFEYPDILREPAGEVLTKFSEGDTPLIWQWFAFAWCGFPLLLAVILLPKSLPQNDSTLVNLATKLGLIAMLAQLIGLLRWTFVIPVLASQYMSPQATEATRSALEVVFIAVHQFGGVLLGEHIGQSFTILWMVGISAFFFGKSRFQTALAVLGFVAGLIYIMGQAELFATVMPDIPVWAEAGLIGSLLWLLWMLLLGLLLITTTSKPLFEDPARSLKAS